MKTVSSFTFSFALVLIFLPVLLWASKTEVQSPLPVLMVNPAPQKILVSIRPYALIAETIKREGDVVEVLLEPGASNHDFQFRPSHLRKIKEADIVIWGGARLEPTLVKALAGKERQLQIEKTDGLKLISSKAGQDLDPHVWYSQHNVSLIAQAMAEALFYPEEATRYLEIQLALQTALKKTEAKGKQAAHLWVYHNAYQYLEEDLGVRHELVIRENHHAQPGLKHWHEVREGLAAIKKTSDTLCLISMPGFESSAEAKKLRKEITDMEMLEQVKIIEIDPLANDEKFGGIDAFLMDSKRRLLSCLK